jgi:uncharacterized membrane protein YbhN (UPF0104 family)
MSSPRLPNVLRIALGLSILTWLAFRLELPRLLALARRGALVDLALGLGFLLLAMLGLQWSRLHVLIKGYAPDLASSLRIFFVGALFNNFFPSNIGGDAVRLYYLNALRAENWGRPVMLLILYRASSFALLVVGGFVYMLFARERLLPLLSAQHLRIQFSPTTWLLMAALGVCAAAGAFALRRRLSAPLLARGRAFAAGCAAALRELSAADLISLLLQTALFHCCRVLAFYFLVRYMGQQVALSDLVFVLSATAVITVLPLSIAGLGVLEASVTGLLVMYGVEVSAAAAVALVNRAVLLLAAAIGGVFYVSGRARAKADLEPAKLPLASS